jgi:hypothetical protein
MTGRFSKWAVAPIALAAALGAAEAAESSGASGAAAAAGTDAPPEKVAPNVSTTPGVYAPKPTPDANAIPAGGAASHDAPASAPAPEAPSLQPAPNGK